MYLDAGKGLGEGGPHPLRGRRRERHDVPSQLAFRLRRLVERIDTRLGAGQPRHHGGGRSGGDEHTTIERHSLLLPGPRECGTCSCTARRRPAGEPQVATGVRPRQSGVPAVSRPERASEATRSAYTRPPDSTCSRILAFASATSPARIAATTALCSCHDRVTRADWLRLELW